MSTLQVARVKATSSFGRLQIAGVRVSGAEPAMVSTLQVARVGVSGPEPAKVSTLQIGRVRVSGSVTPPTLQVSQIKLAGSQVVVYENFGFYLFLNGSLIPLRLDWWSAQKLVPLGNDA